MRNALNGLTLTSLFIIAGCASTDAIYKNYDTLVNVKDGVNEREAKIIAQKIIISTDEQRNYRVTAPDIKTDYETSKYSDYWFVVFGHNWFSPISTDPLAKTYTELKEAQFIVVINKQDGDIKFTGLWYPKRSHDFNWVFDPEAYKRSSQLALPPYEKVQVH
jgi:hypothetical protein